MHAAIESNLAISTPKDTPSSVLELSPKLSVEFVEIYDESDTDLALARNCSNG